MGYIKDQFNHLLCWCFVASDMVSGMRLFCGLDDHYSPLSVWDLCSNCAPYRLGTNLLAKPPHMFYGFNTAAALRYILDYEIYREFLTENVSFMCHEPFLAILSPLLVNLITEQEVSN